MDGESTASEEGTLPAVFIKVQHSLAPYIKSRQEAARIRQVLAAHLDSQLDHKAGHPRLALLSLPDDSATVKYPLKNVHGLEKEYLKSLQANIKARRDFDQISNVDTLSQRPGSAGAPNSFSDAPERKENLESYIALVQRRQRHERLRILQDHVDKLELKSEDATSFLDQSSLHASQLPRAPTDILQTSEESPQNLSETALKDLIRHLEKEVLRAKSHLMSEKQLLEKIKVNFQHGQRIRRDVIPNSAERLQALGRTRNELITWIEEELGKAGDSVLIDGDPQNAQHVSEAEISVDLQLANVKAQYIRYIKARKSFLDVVTDPANLDLFSTPSDNEKYDFEVNETESPHSLTWSVAPYLQDLLLIANEQKSLIQQRSHLSVSLAKQYKENVQTFDRLAHESHLLPLFSASAQKASNRGYGQSDLDELEGSGMLNSPHRALAWSNAAELASKANRDAVLANTEEGDAAIEEARRLLTTLGELLGQSDDVGLKDSKRENVIHDRDIWITNANSKRRDAKNPQHVSEKVSSPGDIWAVLDGNMGVLK